MMILIIMMIPTLIPMRTSQIPSKAAALLKKQSYRTEKLLQQLLMQTVLLKKQSHRLKGLRTAVRMYMPKMRGKVPSRRSSGMTACLNRVWALM